MKQTIYKLAIEKFIEDKYGDYPKVIVTGEYLEFPTVTIQLSDAVIVKFVYDEDEEQWTRKVAVNFELAEAYSNDNIFDYISETVNDIFNSFDDIRGSISVYEE